MYCGVRVGYTCTLSGGFYLGIGFSWSDLWGVFRGVFCEFGIMGFLRLMVKLYLYAWKYVFRISNVNIVECVRLTVLGGW